MSSNNHIVKEQIDHMRYYGLKILRGVILWHGFYSEKTLRCATWIKAEERERS
jgi:hypothetical protein